MCTNSVLLPCNTIKPRLCLVRLSAKRIKQLDNPCLDVDNGDHPVILQSRPNTNESTNLCVRFDVLASALLTFCMLIGMTKTSNWRTSGNSLVRLLSLRVENAGCIRSQCLTLSKSYTPLFPYSCQAACGAACGVVRTTCNHACKISR